MWLLKEKVPLDGEGISGLPIQPQGSLVSDFLVPLICSTEMPSHTQDPQLGLDDTHPTVSEMLEG